MKPSEFMTKALGLRPIHKAILEGDLKRVKRILHQDKSTVNTQTIRDQVTPLHLAVLTGSITTVKLLLLCKASFCTKDKKGYTARQYARSATLRAKKLKQYERLGWQPTKRRDKKARLISTIFREPEALRAILSTNDHPFSGATILTDGKKLTILRKVVTTSLAFPVQNSTCGFIASYESTVPQMMAVSGWKDEGESSTQGVLPNAKMTALVRYACQVMEFKLYMQPYDCPGESVVPPEHVGRYMASHVEKQLSTAWVLKLLQDFLQTSDLARIAELKQVELPPDRSKAKIFLNHSPCGSCLGYLAKIRRVTGVTFAVETIPFVLPGSRAKSTVCANCAGYSNPAAIQPGPSSGARESTPAAEADTEVAERDNDYEELDRQQEVDENGPMVDFGSLVNGEDNEAEDVLPVQPKIDEEGQVETQEEITTPARPEPATEPTRRQVAATRRLQGLLGTSPPGHWEVFQGQNFCAKPLKGVRKRLGLNQEEFNQFLEAQSPRRLLGSPRVPLKSIRSRPSQRPVGLLGNPLTTIIRTANNSTQQNGLGVQNWPNRAVVEPQAGQGCNPREKESDERYSSQKPQQEGSQSHIQQANSKQQPLSLTQATTSSGSLVQPISTINSRSGFFKTPIPAPCPAPVLVTAAGAVPWPSRESSSRLPRNFNSQRQAIHEQSSPPAQSSSPPRSSPLARRLPRLEVCLPHLSSSERSQYAMVPDDEPGSPSENVSTRPRPKTTVQEASKQLNLKRFSYRASTHHKDVYPRLSRPPASSHLLQRLKMGQSKGLPASSIGDSKRKASDFPAATNKASLPAKIRPSKLRRIQERSIFAKAVRRHQENRQLKHQANNQQRGEHEPQQEPKQQEYEKEPMQHGGQPMTPERSSDNTGSRQVLKSIERAASAAPSRDGFSRETPICLD